MIIDRVVYDLTEFIELHPGGRRVVQAYAGLDATHGYARAHHQRPEVDAMREMYRIGMVRALEFDEYTTQIEAPSGPYTVSCRTAHVAWVQALQLVVEMQNALRGGLLVATLRDDVWRSGGRAEPVQTVTRRLRLIAGFSSTITRAGRGDPAQLVADIAGPVRARGERGLDVAGALSYQGVQPRAGYAPAGA